MNIWENTVITAKGIALLSKLVQGNSLTITKAVSGAGYVTPGTLQNQTAISDPKQTLKFRSFSFPSEGKSEVTCYLTNEGLTAGYTAKQIGVYAKDPDEGDILFFITQAVSSAGTIVPAEAESPGFSAEWAFTFPYGRADTVSVTVDPSNTVTHAGMERYVAEATDKLWPTKEATGSAIFIKDSANLPLVGMNIYGKSTQDGTPTPNAPAEIVGVENPTVTVYGKNLAAFPDKSGITSGGITWSCKDGVVTVTGTTTVSQSNTSATISCDLTGYVGTFKMSIDSDVVRLIACVTKDGTTAYHRTTPFTLDGTETQAKIYLQVNDIGVSVNETVHPMCNLGDENLPWEAPSKQRMSAIPNTILHGVHVSSGGNYTDENGQQWVCDEIDFARGVYVQRVESKEFDGVDGETITLYAERENVYGFALKIPDMDMLTIAHAALCTRLENIITGISSVDKECFLCGAGAKTIYVMVNKERLSEYSVAAFKEWLSANPITILFQLATPVETPLSDAEINAFKALTAHNPAMTILNDAGAEMKVQYITKTFERFAKSVTGCTESTEYPGCFYRIIDGEVEWQNPPMVNDVEYRTAERYDGMPVYVKNILFSNANISDGKATKEAYEYGNILVSYFAVRRQNEMTSVLPSYKDDGSISAFARINSVHAALGVAGVTNVFAEIVSPGTTDFSDYQFTVKYCK